MLEILNNLNWFVTLFFSFFFGFSLPCDLHMYNEVGWGGERRLLWDWIFFVVHYLYQLIWDSAQQSFLASLTFKQVNVLKQDRHLCQDRVITCGNRCTWFMEFNLTWAVSKLCCGYFESLFSLTFKQGAILSVGKAGCMMEGALQPGICSVVIYSCDSCRRWAKRVWAWVHWPCTSMGPWQWGFSCQQPCWMAGIAAVSSQEEAFISFWLLQTGLISVLFIQVFLYKFSKDIEFDLCVHSFPSS